MNLNVETVLKRLAPYDVGITKLCKIYQYDNPALEIAMRNRDSISIAQDWRIRDWSSFSLHRMHHLARSVTYDGLANHLWDKSCERNADSVAIIIPTPIWIALTDRSLSDTVGARMRIPFGAIHSPKAIIQQSIKPSMLHDIGSRSILDAVSAMSLLVADAALQIEIAHWLYQIDLIINLPDDFAKRVRAAGFFERNFMDMDHAHYFMFLLQDSQNENVDVLWEMFRDHLIKTIEWKTEPMPVEDFEVFKRIFFQKIANGLRHGSYARNISPTQISRCKGIGRTAPFITTAYFKRHISDAVNHSTFSLDFGTKAQQLFNKTDQKYLSSGALYPVRTDVSASKLVTIKKLILKGNV